MSLEKALFETNKELLCYKEKFMKMLEEKSLLEDEIMSIANLAKNYQTEAKHYSEEIESLKSSYSLICSQNSQLESEVITLTIDLNNLTHKLNDLESLNSNYEKELERLKELTNEDSKKSAIKELSYIILSKEHSPESKILKSNHNQIIRDALENKIKDMETERNEYLLSYKECLYKYVAVLKELLKADQNSLN